MRGRIGAKPPTPAEHYSQLDRVLTEILDKAGSTITPEVDNLLVWFNWDLREALGLPNILH